MVTDSAFMYERTAHFEFFSEMRVLCMRYTRAPPIGRSLSNRCKQVWNEKKTD